MHQPWPGLQQGRPLCQRTSQRRSIVTTTTPGVGGLPAWTYACEACVRAKEDDGKSQKLSGKGSPSPSRRAGANLNPRLTLALVHAESPTASRGGAAGPALHPRGREEHPEGPRNQAVGPPQVGEKGEDGGATITTQRGTHPVHRQSISIEVQGDENLLTARDDGPQAQRPQ
jgi:hypothetical protein